MRNGELGIDEIGIGEMGIGEMGWNQMFLVVLRKRNFSQNFTQKFPENFGTKVCNFLTKLSREAFVKSSHPGRLKF